MPDEHEQDRGVIWRVARHITPKAFDDEFWRGAGATPGQKIAKQMAFDRAKRAVAGVEEILGAPLRQTERENRT